MVFKIPKMKAQVKQKCHSTPSPLHPPSGSVYAAEHTKHLEKGRLPEISQKQNNILPAKLNSFLVHFSLLLNQLYPKAMELQLVLYSLPLVSNFLSP